MPLKTERERLADLEQRSLELSRQVEDARRAVRSKYAILIGELAVETLSEREFRDLIVQAIRAGGAASVSALKALPARSA